LDGYCMLLTVPDLLWAVGGTEGTRTQQGHLACW